MPPLKEWCVPPEAQPQAADCAFDLDLALAAMTGLRAVVPEDAFTAGILGTERAGNGVVIRRDGLVLTIGYLITEAESVWLSLSDGRSVPAHVLAYDQITGFGLVQALARLDVPALPLGSSAAARVGDPVVVGGAGGRQRSVAARIVAKQEFAGYWEYLLDEAIFTAPSHPNWGGAGLIDHAGTLIGIGSLQLQQGREGQPQTDVNMIVPIDLLKPTLNDMMTLGRPNRPPRPWLGIYATEVAGKVVVAGLAGRGPAQKADVRIGDVVLAVAGDRVSGLADFYRRVWSLGEAGVSVPLTIYRDGRAIEVPVPSTDRGRLLKRPNLQ
ncbi:MAG: serine protease [Rhodospirillaceae bacterium]|nr:serine protease [Rhodospirillaceae bacterium]